MSNTTYDIPVVASGVNAPSVSLLNDDAESRTFIFASTVTSDRVAIYGSNDGINFPPIVNTTPLLSMGGNSAPITLNDRSLQYRAVFTGSGVRTLKVRAGTCCAGGGTVPSEHFVTLALGNFPAGGVIGTAAATVDQFAAFTINQTTAGQTLTFPAPTDPTATYVRWVSNIGTQAFALYGLLVLPGSGTKLIWNGSAWFNGCVGTSTPTFTVVGAAGKDVFNSDGTVTAIGNAETAVPASMLQLLAGSGGLTQVVDSTGDWQAFTAAGQVQIDTNGGGIRIGDISPFAKTVTVGSAIGASATSIKAGTGGCGLGDNATDHSTAVGSVIGVSLTSIQFGTGGCHIQGVAGGTIGIGNNVVDHDTVIGSITGLSLLTLQGGTNGVTIQPVATGPLTAKSGSTGTATFDSGSTGAVHLGDGAAVKTVTLGSITGASSLAIRAGTGGLQIVNNGATWTWPTALGAAGTKLTDAAGNGVLSFA